MHHTPFTFKHFPRKMSQVRAKKYKTAETKLLKILHQLETLKLNNSYISKLELPLNKNKSCYPNYLKNKTYHGVFGVVLALLILAGSWWIYSEISSKQCILSTPQTVKPLFRPPEDCSICEHITSAATITNVTAVKFEEYAYSAVPVVVTDAMDGWKAMKEFNFEFFSNFYKTEKMGKKINDCFFFPYKSGFKSLQEVFDMDEKRANLSGKPWYVGWSTCYEEESRKLRSFYNRPYFIPATAESDMVDWIFMGGPGQGAHMHVDSVRHKSWQAQIRGTKRWQLAPPPECLYRCHWMDITVAPTQCIVVDTNYWYHRTSVLPGDISITIGAEYD